MKTRAFSPLPYRSTVIAPLSITASGERANGVEPVGEESDAARARAARRLMAALGIKSRRVIRKARCPSNEPNGGARRTLGPYSWNRLVVRIDG